MSQLVEGPAPCTTREVVLVTLALQALIGLQLVSVDALYLFSKYFWIDELYTYTVVADPDLGHVFQAIRGGIGTMPTFNMFLRAVSVFVAPSEVLFRGVTLGTMVLALSGVYVILRRSVDPLVALAAVLVVWAHPFSVAHAFDARPYGPLLAASVWFCYWMDRRQAAPDRRWTGLGLAVTSLALCSLHVYGVFVWAIVLVAAGIIRRRWRPPWPALIGPLVVPVLWMLAVQPQRDAYTIPTWEAAFSWGNAATMFEAVFLPGHVAAVFLVIWGVLCVQRVFTPRAEQVSAPPPAPAMLLLTSLSLLVPLIVVVSFVAQPTLTVRYGMPAIAALAPAVAYSLARLPRWGTAVVLVVLVGASTNGLRESAIEARAQDRQTDALARAIRELPADRQVVFEVTHVLQVICHYAPDLNPRVVRLDFEDGQMPHATRLRIVNRDLARVYARFYECPRSVTWDALRSSTEFYFAPDFRSHSQPPTPETRYPGFTVTPGSPHVRKATRR